MLRTPPSPSGARFRTGMTMKPVFDQARASVQRVVYAEGEQDKVLQVVQQALEQRIAKPVLIGRRAVVEERLGALGLDIRPGRDFELLDPQDNPRFESHVAAFYQRAKRRGYAPDEARETIRNSPTALAATLLRTAEVDASYAAYDAHPLDEPDEWGDLASFRRAVGAS